MHFILRHLKASMCDDADIQVIATNSEQLISAQFQGLRFIDSFQFLSTSLEKLVCNLRESGLENFHHTIRHFGSDPIHFSKGVYCYEYVDSVERFEETQLPPKDKFFSRLTEEDISDEEYARAKEVFGKMGCRNIGDYHDYYLALDVLLLADVFEAFRKLALKIYGMDPPHFFTLPGMSWDACLKKTGAKLELLTDEAMYLFFENNIRGGNLFLFFYKMKVNFDCIYFESDD
jgi:hypothetical protein